LKTSLLQPAFAGFFRRALLGTGLESVKRMPPPLGGGEAHSGSPWPIDSPCYTTVAGEFQLSDSAYGTFDQGGNVLEWSDTLANPSHDALRGGSFYGDSGHLLASFRDYGYLWIEDGAIGFRVASVPEPGSLAMLAGIALTALLCWWRKQA
jgi:formylglycine-generating enzyme